MCRLTFINNQCKTNHCFGLRRYLYIQSIFHFKSLFFYRSKWQYRGNSQQFTYMLVQRLLVQKFTFLESRHNCVRECLSGLPSKEELSDFLSLYFLRFSFSVFSIQNQSCNMYTLLIVGVAFSGFEYQSSVLSSKFNLLN